LQPSKPLGDTDDHAFAAFGRCLRKSQWDVFLIVLQALTVFFDPGFVTALCG
jgi:hypothetical protein